MTSKARAVDIERFRHHMRPLTPSERENLLEQLRRDGLRDSPTVASLEGKQFLVDGFHRKELCEELGIDWARHFVEITFTSENEALDWIESNARGRRSQTRTERNYYIGLRYLREKGGQGGDRGNQHTGGKGKTVASATDSTAEAIARQEGCSHQHVKNWAKNAELINRVAEAFPFLKWPILSEQIAFSPKWASNLLAQSNRVTAESLEEMVQGAASLFSQRFRDT